VLVAPLAAQAATLTVTSSADSGAGSLRDVIAASNPGDTIVFDPSVTSVALQTGIDLDWGVTIDGGDTVTITRTNTNNFQQFAFGPELPGQDLTIKNITIEESPTVKDRRFTRAMASITTSRTTSLSKS
jgi:hypothetical protein